MSAMHKRTSAEVFTSSTRVIYDGLHDTFGVWHMEDDQPEKVSILPMTRDQARELFNALGVLLRESNKWAG